MSKIQKRPLLIEIDTNAKKCKTEQAKTNIIDVNKFATTQIPCSIANERNINVENLINIPLMINKTSTAKNVSNTQFIVHKNLIYLTGKPHIHTSKKLPEHSLDLDEADLQVLLQNFYKLESDEQQVLISHLKKLEKYKPDIVNNLKRFVRVAGPEFKIPEEKDDCESDLNDLDDLDDILEETDIIITNSDDESIVNIINNDNSTQPVETHIKSPVNHKIITDLIKSSAEVNYEAIYLALEAITSVEEVKHEIIDLTLSPEPCEILPNLETLTNNTITEETESKISINDSSKSKKQEKNLSENITENKEQKIQINLLSKLEKEDVNVIEENNISVIDITHEEEERIKPEDPVQKIEVIVEPEAEIKESKQDLKPTKAETKIEISEFDKKESVKKEDDKQIDIVKIESVKKDPVIKQEGDKKIDIVKIDQVIKNESDNKIDIVKTEQIESDKKYQVIEKKDDKETVQKLEEKDNEQINQKVEKKDDKQIELKEEKKNDKQIEKKDDKQIELKEVKKDKDDKIIDQKVEQKDAKQTEQKAEKKSDKETGKNVEKKNDKETGKKVDPPPKEIKPQPPVNMKKNKKTLLPKPKLKRFPFKPVLNRTNYFQSRQRAMAWRNNVNHPAYDCGYNKGYDQEFQDNYDHEYQDNYDHEYQDNYNHEFQNNDHEFQNNDHEFQNNDHEYHDNYDHEYQDNYDHEHQDWQRNAMEETYYHRQQERVQRHCHPERRAQHFGHRNRNQQEMRQYFGRRSRICTSGNFYSFN